MSELYRLLIGTLLFSTGCLLTYRSKFGSNRTEFVGLLLILLGLVSGFWDRLWL